MLSLMVMGFGNRLKLFRSRLRSAPLVVVLLLLLLLGLSSCAGNGQKRFENLELVIFAGGDPDFFFSRLVADGARAASEDLGAAIELKWANWENERMISQFKEAIEEAPDGIAIMGHPGEAAMAPFVREARRKAIVVTSLNTPLPELEQEYFASGFGYVGQNTGTSGKNLAEASIRKFNLEPDDTVLVYGVASYPIRGERTRSAVQVFREAGMTVVYEEHLRGSTAAEDTRNEVAAIRAMINSHPEASLLFDDTDLVSSASALREAGVGPDAIPLVGFDLSPELVNAIREGYVDLVSDQQPYLQGYLAVLQLCFSVEYGFQGLHIDTGGGLIDGSNIEEVAALVERGIR